MRTSPLHDKLAAHDVAFDARYGCEVAARCADADTEYARVRDSVGITDVSYMQTFCIPEEEGIDFLDSLFAGNVARIRFGRVLHTFLADDDGKLLADCYVANNDDEFVVLCESLVDDETLAGVFAANGAADAGLQDLSATHAVISIDGCRAWAVVKDLFGADVLGLPYLSIEVYPFDDVEVRLLRAGKTAEFGYLLVVPDQAAEALFDTVLSRAAEVEGGGLCGVDIHHDLRLEGRFFDIYAEGAEVRDPLELGLQWMIDFDKDEFRGREAILARRDAGQQQKVIGVRFDGNNDAFAAGAELYDGDDAVGRIVTTARSRVLEADLGLAMLRMDAAYAGLRLALGSADGPAVQTISMPPIMPKSLGIRLDEL